MDKNSDGEISLEEFQQIFELAPDAMPDVLGPLVDTLGNALDSLGKVGLVVWAPLTSGVGAVGNALKALDWRDTNVGNIGSDEDKAARRAAAAAEEAWHGCGKMEGVEVWRIEAFKVVPWPRKDMGKFYDGDSYIVLHTYKENPLSPKLLHDIYFWLGAETTTDEMGAAAYKTVELDDLFGGEPVQVSCCVPPCSSPLLAHVVSDHNPDANANASPSPITHHPSPTLTQAASRDNAPRERGVQVALQIGHVPQGWRQERVQAGNCHLAFRAGTTPTLAFCSRRRPLCVALPFA